MHSIKYLTRFLLLTGLICVAQPLAAATVDVSPGDDLEGATAALEPGDVLRLADGTYELSGRFGVTLSGTVDAPIVIEAAPGASPLIHRPTASQNIWDLNATHVTIRGLRFSGGSAGLRFESATHVRIEACEIFDTADVALRMNDGGQTYENIEIVRNHIHDTSGTGEGMYLGCNNDGCRMANSLIAENYVHHTNGPNVSQGDGIEVKEGSYGMVVRDNVLHDTNYPCLLMYSTVGNGSRNTIERNVMWNCGDNAMQVAADATIKNNIVLGAASSGIALQPHQNGTPQNLEVLHNTVINTGDAIALRGADGTILIANNAAYSQSGHAIRQQGDLSAVTISGNIGMGGLSQGSGGLANGAIDVDFADASFAGGPMDVFPAETGSLPAAGDETHATTLDFNSNTRGGVADVGAYRFDASGNPGWVIAADFKAVGDSAPGDGDSPDGGMTDTGSADTGDADTGASVADSGARDTESNDVQVGDDASGDSGRQDTDGALEAGGDASSGCNCNQSPTPGRPAGHLIVFAIGALLLRVRTIRR